METVFYLTMVQTEIHIGKVAYVIQNRLEYNGNLWLLVAAVQKHLESYMFPLLKWIIEIAFFILLLLRMHDSLLYIVNISSAFCAVTSRSR